jgi:hypothetical protein
VRDIVGAWGGGGGGERPPSLHDVTFSLVEWKFYS